MTRHDEDGLAGSKARHPSNFDREAWRRQVLTDTIGGEVRSPEWMERDPETGEVP